MIFGYWPSWGAPAPQTPRGCLPIAFPGGLPPPRPQGEAGTSRAGNGNNNPRGAKRPGGAPPKAAPVVVPIPGPARPGSPRRLGGKSPPGKAIGRPPGGSGGREPPRKANTAKLSYALGPVARFYWRALTCFQTSNGGGRVPLRGRAGAGRCCGRRGGARRPWYVEKKTNQVNLPRTNSYEPAKDQPRTNQGPRTKDQPKTNQGPRTKDQPRTNQRPRTMD